jgi:hypothetical protein
MTNTSPTNPNRVNWHGAEVTYGDWRDRLVQEARISNPLMDNYRRFLPIPLGEGLMLSAQNSPYHYVTGRAFSLDAEGFDPVALVDFEVAFFFEGGGDLLEKGQFAPLDRLLAEADIVWNGDIVIGWVPAENIGRLLSRVQEMANPPAPGADDA